ncbi:hypothetical protein ACFYW6_12535 [Streptomyces sp. NPDC002659]|uniref:hypothetical protein n=1 Tax=Streptomyces sp. NPDC002659 TaxID=3364656 RepID=UPI0036B21BB7
MGSLSFRDVADVDLGKLGTSVADWKKTVDNLKILADSAEKGLLAKSESANWAGVNAGVTREFIKKTRKEFSDAYAEADTIWGLLNDAHRELVGIQKKIQTAIETDAPNLGVRIEDAGDGGVRWFFPHIRGDSDERTQAQLDGAQALADRIAGLVAHAAEIDASVTRALGKAHGSDPNNFGHKTYESLDDAQAERALELAKPGSKMTDKQFTELNSIMKYNRSDPEFTTAFYKGLGDPKDVLEFYGRMSLDGTEGDNKTRLALTKEFQQNMGVSLATATDPGNKTHLPAGWGAQFRKLGTQQIKLEPDAVDQPYGYQILGGMLRYGNYDPSFINPIAEHVTQLHHDKPDMFMLNKPSGLGDHDWGFNASGKMGAGYDPLASVLEGLGHSPEAASKFFDDQTVPTVYAEDGSIKKGETLGYNYLEEFLKEDFKWPADTLMVPAEGDVSDVRNSGPDALGHALEAATTGRAYDDDAGDAIRHRPEMVRLTERLVQEFGTNPGLLAHNENGDLENAETGPLYAMRDSMGDITAEYMGDFQRTMYNGAPDKFPAFGDSATFDPDQAKNFLSVVGQDPDAYASITSAQQAYTSDLVDEAINGDTASKASVDGRVRDAVAPGAAMAGIMSEARAHAVIDYHTAKDEEFNAAAEEKAGWVNRIVSMGTAGVGERVPIAGEVLGWVQEDITSSVLETIAKDSADDASQAAGEEYTSGRTAALDSSEAAVSRAVLNNQEGPYSDPDTASQLKSAAKTQAGNSHGEGAKWYAASHTS